MAAAAAAERVTRGAHDDEVQGATVSVDERSARGERVGLREVVWLRRGLHFEAVMRDVRKGKCSLGATVVLDCHAPMSNNVGEK